MTTDDGLKGEVSDVSVLRQVVKVLVTLDNDVKELRDYKVKQLKFRPQAPAKLNINDAELKKLEALEKKDGKSALH